MKPITKARPVRQPAGKTQKKFKAYAYKQFSHTEVYRESSPFDPRAYIEKVCASGWRPFETVEGRGEKTDAQGRVIPIYYVLVQAVREIEVDELAPEPEITI